MRKWTGVPWPTAPVGSRYFRLLELNMGTSLFLLGMGGANRPRARQKGEPELPLGWLLALFRGEVLLGRYRGGVPDVPGVVPDGPVRGEAAGLGDVYQGHAVPAALVAVQVLGLLLGGR